MPRTRISLLLSSLVVALVACSDSPTEPGGPTPSAPGGLEARYEWALDGWIGVQPAGQPTVLVTWAVPTAWQGEPFRVYSRRSTDADYRLAATVTSCSGGFCRYVDADIAAGREYDYYVAVVDERDGREVTTPDAVRVGVPAGARPARPPAPSGVALDDMLYLHWQDVDLGGRFWKFLVFQERRDADSVFFQVGETDGNGFLDVLAQNGVGYRYSIAVVDIDGHVSDRSPLGDALIPRPDGAGALVLAHADEASSSGFQFDAATGAGRVVAGGSASAHWRFEADADGWWIRPLGGAAVLDAGFTTALTCGPGSDPGCQAVHRAPDAGYTTDRVPADLEHTYVIRTGSGASVRYAKIRVQILGYDGQDRRLMIFDWAFQTVPGVPNLHLGG
jgi:hypothetical protein